MKKKVLCIMSFLIFLTLFFSGCQFFDGDESKFIGTWTAYVAKDQSEFSPYGLLIKSEEPSLSVSECDCKINITLSDSIAVYNFFSDKTLVITPMTGDNLRIGWRIDNNRLVLTEDTIIAVINYCFCKTTFNNITYEVIKLVYPQGVAVVLLR